MQLGGVFFDKTLAEGPSAAPVRFCFWHTVRIDSSCAQCKYLSVVPTVNSVPPAVVPPASRVPPSRHCTAFAAYAEPTPDNQYTTFVTCVGAGRVSGQVTDLEQNVLAGTT